MAVEKVGVYRKWLEPVPKDKNGKPIPKSQWARKRRHCWIVRWYGSDQKTRYGKVFKTRKEAARYATELQRRVALGRADKPRRVTLRQFLEEHARVTKGQVAYGTLQEQMGALRLFEKFIGGSITLERIQSRQAEAFVADRLASKEVSVATVNKYIRTLRGVFNVAIELRGYLQEGQNPFAKIKERKVTESRIRYVHVREHRSLMGATEDIWWHALLSIAYGSGLRRNEILYLTWADVDFAHQLLKVTAKKASAEMIEWQPKSRRNRIVPMSDETAHLLINMQTEATEGHPYVFISPERLKRIIYRRQIGKWTSRSEPINNLAERFRQIRCAAGVADCTIHDHRRSAITNWALKLPIQVVQTLAGHSSITTTRKYYLAVRSEDFESAHRWVNHVLAGTCDD